MQRENGFAQHTKNGLTLYASGDNIVNVIVSAEKRCFALDKHYLIERLDIKHYRGLNDLVIDDLARVNVFVGANNSGKTSILEAVRLLGSPDSFGNVVRVALRRAQASSAAKVKNIVNYVLSMFQRSSDDDGQDHYHIQMGVKTEDKDISYDVDGTVGEAVDSTGATKKTLDIVIKTSVNGERENYDRCQIVNGEDAKFTSTKKPIYRSLYLPSTIGYYRACVELSSDYIARDGQAHLLNILQSFDKSIDGISIVGEEIYLHSETVGSMPLFTYGSGLQKALLLTLMIAYCKGGIILVDEIDNAIHVSAFRDVFGWFLDACEKWNVQAFITTHSAEAIDTILEINHEHHKEDDMLRVITMRKGADGYTTRKRVRTGEEAYSDREDFKMELRV